VPEKAGEAIFKLAREYDSPDRDSKWEELINFPQICPANFNQAAEVYP
jgi:hypothetical protein